jgi:uncharacterized protein
MCRMARQGKQSGKRSGKARGGASSAERPRNGWSWWVGGLIAAAALAFVAGIGVGVMLGEGHDIEQATPTKQPLAPRLAPRLAATEPEKSAKRRVVALASPSPSLTTLPSNPVRITLAPAPKPLARRTWEENAAAFTVAPGTPLIAIVLDDMGLNRRRSERAARLPGPLTLSYLSYANDLAAQTGAARARGHEIMLHLPMEPEGDADPGPGALLVRLSDAKLRERIDFALGRFPGFVGVNNHMGSRFTADAARMTLVFDALRRSGHLFLDSLTTPNAVAMSLGPRAGVPTIARDVFLDDVDTQDEVWFRLLKAEQIAETQGTAIAIGHPRDATLAVLEDWIAELSHRSARLAPISAVARVRLGRRLQVMVKP